LHPDENFVATKSGRRIGYDYLVIGLGIQIDWGKIPGLQEGIGRNQICSNYSYQQVDYTWECVRNFKGGNAVFTMPNTAVKCGGAPQWSSNLQNWRGSTKTNSSTGPELNLGDSRGTYYRQV